MTLQDYKYVGSIRAAAILTNSYVAATVISDTEKYNQLVLGIYFTKGSLTTLEIKIEFSLDGTTYLQETFASISDGTELNALGEHQIGATGNYTLLIPIKYPFIKISAKGTGTVTDSVLSIDAALGVI